MKQWQKRKNQYSVVKNTTIPLLKSMGIKRINYLILTHGDYDHAGDTINLIENFKVDKIYLNQGNFNYLEKKIITSFKNTYQVKEGQIFYLGDLVLIELNKEFSDENDSSSVFLLIYNDVKVLLTGDASIKSEKYILDNYDIGKINILKLGHHGSKTSTSNLLLKSTSPDLALISCGYNNKFKHPNKETLKKLNKYRISYLRTDFEGTITIDLNTLKIK